MSGTHDGQSILQGCCVVLVLVFRLSRCQSLSIAQKEIEKLLDFQVTSECDTPDLFPTNMRKV